MNGKGSASDLKIVNKYQERFLAYPSNFPRLLWSLGRKQSCAVLRAVALPHSVRWETVVLAGNGMLLKSKVLINLIII